MTDLGGGYRPQGDQPWYPGEPGHGGQQQYGQQQNTGGWQQQYGGQQQGGGWPQQQYPQQQPGYPQQQPYGRPGYPQQYPGQQFPQQQMPQQFPQQQVSQQFPQQGAPQYGQPYPGQQAGQDHTGRQPVVRPAPSGPGPDGIDWEAEAAALEGGHATEDHVVEEHYTEDEFAQDEEFAEDEDHPFFGDEDNSREAERKRKEKGKKAGRRNGGACLLVALILLGGLGGAGWYGYGFYQSHFGPPPDYTGDGSGSVTITVPDGASGASMGAALKDADVVKSTKAFVAAYGKNPKAPSIQPGSYTMHHQMSAAAAVQLMVDSNGGSALIIPEGMRAAEIYAKIDGKLKLAKGTTAGVAQAQVATLGLPAYAQANLEGFLFPQRYSISDGMKPEDLLKQMVAAAVQHYTDLKLDEGAQKIGLKNGYQVIVEASILQREGNNDKDFGKIARVLYNRLNTQATQGKLQLDTTLQYKLGRTNFTEAERDGDKSGYNTYVNKGLPPTPISNPGDAAISAVLNPTPGDWVYFVAVSKTDTRFSATFDQFKKDVKEYCTANNNGFDEKAGTCKTQ